MKKFVLIASVMLVLVGCASTPVIDMQNVDYGLYQQDLAECQLYANQQDTIGNGLAGGGIGAGIGAAGGALTGVIVDGIATGPAALLGVAIGGLVGIVAGVSESVNREETIVRNCMSGRGYNVLD